MEVGDRFSGGVRALRPHIERLAADKELHAHLKSAYASGRVIYERVFPARRPSAVVRRLSGDPKLQGELARGIEEPRAVGRGISGRPGQRGARAAAIVRGLGHVALLDTPGGVAAPRWM